MADVLQYWSLAVNLLAGSLVDAWLGASWATRLASKTLCRVLAVLLLALAAVLVGGHSGRLQPAEIDDPALRAAGVAAGFVIGVVAALLGVAGGELIIPTVRIPRTLGP